MLQLMDHLALGGHLSPKPIDPITLFFSSSARLKK